MRATPAAVRFLCFHLKLSCHKARICRVKEHWHLQSLLAVAESGAMLSAAACNMPPVLCVQANRRHQTRR